MLPGWKAVENVRENWKATGSVLENAMGSVVERWSATSSALESLKAMGAMGSMFERQKASPREMQRMQLHDELHPPW